jgi:hypothetical protein
VDERQQLLVHEPQQRFVQEVARRVRQESWQEMRRSSLLPPDPARAGRRPFGTVWGQNTANGLEEEEELQQWIKVRDEEEHHRLSSCPMPEFSTMATSDDETKRMLS